MENQLMAYFQQQINKNKVSLQKCNRVSEHFGLSLTEEQMTLLNQNRIETLQKTGRIEFGEGILEKLVYVFCDSPYIQQDEYAQLLIDLQELFYILKGETQEKMTDDELLAAMRRTFDSSGGSLERLKGGEL
ncbi:MAG: DUF6323 family protein [Lachnospiraceae bacterium]